MATYIMAPGHSVGKTLAVGTNADHPEIIYDLSDPNNAITKLGPTYTAPNDQTGSIALEQITAHKDTRYPLGNFDVTYLGASRSKANFADMTGPFWVAKLRVRNMTLGPAHLDFSTLQVTLARKGVEEGVDGKPYPENATDAPFSLDLRPGTEVVVQYPFTLPAGDQPARLTLTEGKS
ncbi:MAG TPA: hypothetical protein VHR86_02425, partial [Armatimonadota bacterium]|nr:hypothetical protein [Armatimonadota bacterium]